MTIIASGCASQRGRTTALKLPVSVSSTASRQPLSTQPTSTTKPDRPKIGLVSHVQEEDSTSVRSPEIQSLDAPGSPLSDSPDANSSSSLEENVASDELGFTPIAGTLSLNQVLRSVTVCYPEIEIAIGEIQSAQGKALAAQGNFDDRLTLHTIAQPLGFYQTYRNGVGMARPLFGGGEIYTTYRIGDGNFEPWFGERETNEGGELKAGFSLPLLKDRAIDKRRAKLFAAEFQRDQVSANVDARLLQFQRMATQAYWDWVASGRAVKVQNRLLTLAEDRIDQIEERILDEDLPKLARIDNGRFIRKRRNTLIKARRALEKAAIKMSLYWRDANCTPQVATAEQLPPRFPDATPISPSQVQSDIAQAISVRPELNEQQAARQQAAIDLQYARNLTLPKVDLKGFAGQDLGGETSSKGDKTPFELQLAILAEVPMQRREGLGKIQAAQGKLAQIDAKIRMISDKIRAEVQDAASAVNAAYEQILQSTANLELTQKSLELAKVSFEAGEIDLISLNIYETDVADAELELLDGQFKYFIYKVIYQTAIKREAFTNLNATGN